MTPRQQRFIAEYVKDLNATQAYMRAGYSPGGAAQAAEKLLRNAEICLAIAKLQKAIGDRLEITAEKVLRDLESTRTSAIASEEWGPAIRASELQGKHIGMFGERVTITDERSVIRAPETSDSPDAWQTSHKPH